MKHLVVQKFCLSVFRESDLQFNEPVLRSFLTRQTKYMLF